MHNVRTALYGGSFNPIHEGHLNLGDFVIEQGLVDECWFVVSPKNPLKATADPSDAEQRYRAVEKALKTHFGCRASDIEFGLPTPNYTVQTVKYAQQLYPNRDFVLLIGGDNLDVFTQWKDYNYLLENVDIIVYPRPGAKNTVPDDWKRVKLLEAPMYAISSTELRKKQTEVPLKSV